MMQAVIMAGGLGTRLRPLTDKIPKVLVPIKGRPFIAYLLDLLKNGGVDEVVICAGHLSDPIMEFVINGERWGIEVSYCIEKEPLGTAGALKQAEPLLHDTFLVVNGDTYLSINHRAVMNFFLSSTGKAAMVVSSHSEFKGDVLVEGGMIYENNKREPKPYFNYVNAGLLALRREVLSLIPGGIKGDLEDCLYQKLIEEGLLAAYTIRDKFYDIGTLQGIEALENLFSLLKLEIGAGESPRPGYVHTDISEFPDIEYVCSAWDVPLRDGSCEEIFLTGVWEHFHYDEARRAIDKFRRLLVPGGLLKFTTPDLDLMCKYWVDRSVRHLQGRPWKEQREYILRALWGSQVRENMIHQWGWNRETIVELLDDFEFDVVSIDDNVFEPWTHLNVVARKRQGDNNPDAL